MIEHKKIKGLGKVIDLKLPVVGGGGDKAVHRPVVLLLEDDPLISMDIEMTLVDAGFEVHCAMSCKNAHEWLDRHRPDVVIVDIVLRDGRCTEVVSRLLQAQIPFIVHSGDNHGMHAGTPFELGTWVTKPSAPSALVQAVNAAAVAQAMLGKALPVGELSKL